MVSEIFQPGGRDYGHVHRRRRPAGQILLHLRPESAAGKPDRVCFGRAALARPHTESKSGGVIASACDELLLTRSRTESKRSGLEEWACAAGELASVLSRDPKLARFLVDETAFNVGLAALSSTFVGALPRS